MRLQEKIHYKFSNYRLLKEALTHSSYANENHLHFNYERLEFLGDAILEAVTSDYLIKKFHKFNEGQLTKARKELVSEAALSCRAEDLNLGQYIYLGKGEEKTGGREKPGILCDVIEALIGAIYLDGGYGSARNFIHQFVLTGEPIIDTDYKTTLQEVYGINMEYVVTNQTDLDENNQRTYYVDVMFNGKVIGSGSGRNKKAAEQMAAKKALEQEQERD